MNNSFSKFKSTNAWRGCLFFAAFGPLMGLLFFLLLFFFLPDNHYQGFSDDSSSRFFKAAPYLLFISYALGLVPAAITGFIIGLRRSRLKGILAFLKAGLIGAAITLLCAIAWVVVGSLIKRGQLNSELIFSSVIFVFPGFFSGIVTSLLFVAFIKSKESKEAVSQ